MIYHIWRDFVGRNADETARNELAQRTWANPGRVSVPVKTTDLPRLFDEGKEQIPFIKDVLDYGVKGLPENAMVIFTPSDIGLAPTALFRIVAALRDEDAGDAHRHLFPEGRITLPTEIEIDAATRDPGKGLWFFRAGWWRARREAFPDMLLPRAAWDWVMRVLIQDTIRKQYFELSGICWHVEHPFLYHLPEMEGNRHNLRLVIPYFQKRGVIDPMQIDNMFAPKFFGLNASEFL